MLEERLLRRLSSLHYAVRHSVTGRVGGKHSSRRKGLSQDFSEHRAYLQGDDYRYIDWNLYGRLDRLYVKVFSREEDYPVYVLLDLSRSMGVGQKLRFAQQLAAALGYVALKDQNRLGVYPFSKQLGLEQSWPPRSGWKQTLALFEYLQTLELERDTDFNRALSQFAKLNVHRGLVVVLSDMFGQDGYERGLVALRSAGFSVTVLQLLAESDQAPRLSNEVWLTSAERGSQRRRLGGPQAVQGYVAAVGRYVERLRAFCQRHEIEQLSLSTALPLEQVILERLRGGILR